VALTWLPTTGAVGYDAYVEGLGVGTTSLPAYTFTGLTCGTSYTFGIASYNASAVTSPISSLIVTTASCPDVTPPTPPTNLAEASSTTTSITAVWSAATDDSGIADYRVFVDGALATTTSSTSYTATGLACGTLHQIVVDAQDAAGNTSPQTSATMATAACAPPPPGDTTPPSTPGSLAITTSTRTTLALSWTPSTDDVGVVGYGVYENGTIVATSSVPLFTVSGLVCGTSYSIGVDAYDAAGNRSAKATLTAGTASCPDLTPPSAPTGLATSNITQTSLALSWNASTDNVGVTGYGVYRNGTLTSSPTGTSASLTGLTCGTTYTLAVDAVDAAGNRSAKTSVSARTSACPDTTAPSTPTGLAVSSSTTTSIGLTWNASTDNVGVTGYGVYQNGTLTATPTGTSTTLGGLTCGTSYTLAVDATDAAGNRSARATITGSTAACPDTTPPSAPTNVATSNVAATSLTLSWTASTDNVGVVGYGVYRNGTLVASPAGTSVSLTGLTCGTSYTLAVDAADAAGNRSTKSSITASTAVCDTTPPSVPSGLASSGVSQSSVSLSWNASSDNVGVAGYGVYRNGTLVASPSGTTASVSGLTCGTSYSFTVDAVDGAGNRSAQSSPLAVATAACSDTTPPSTPTGLAASGVTQTSASLSWNASTDNVGVTGYRLFQNGVQVGTALSTSYLFSGLACGTSYTLGVAAVDGAGNVSGTASLPVTTAACSGGSSANLAVSTSGNDSTCVRGNLTKPCATLGRAYTLAQAGDLITVGCGSYPGQTLPARSLGTTPVTIEKDPADSSCSFITLTGSLTINASYVVVSGFSVLNNNTISMNPPGTSSCTLSHITIENFQASGVDGGCDHITLLHGDVGTDQNACTGGSEDGVQFRGPTPTGNFSDLIPPTNMLIDDVTIHDTTGFVACGSHTDGFQSFGCNNCTVQNSRFINNDTSDIIIYQITGAAGDIQNILIQNNSFGSVAHPGHGVSIGGQACPSAIPNNVIIQNNTFYTTSTLDVNCTNGNTAGTVRNNIFAANDNGFACGSKLVFDYNVFASNATTCGTHAKKCTPSFVDPNHANGNIDLNTTDTCAKDTIPTTATYPTTDTHGTPRPQGTAVDAGADEAG